MIADVVAWERCDWRPDIPSVCNIGAVSVITVAEAQAVLDGSPFGPWWRFRVVAVGDGTASVRLDAREELFRPGGILHGGCCMTLADVAFWIAIMTTGGVHDPSVTVEMKTNFLRAATTDVISRAELLSDGRRIAYGTASTRDRNERLVAHHTLTYLRVTAERR